MGSPNDALRCSRCNRFHSDTVNCPSPLSAYTPGPWSVSMLGGRNIGPTRILHTEDGDVWQFQSVAVVRERTGETDANARLIAKAPDLFAFAEKIARWGYTVTSESADILVDEARELVKAIAAVDPHAPNTGTPSPRDETSS